MAAPQTIDDLRPNPDNPRTITTRSQTGLRSSLERFGDLSGITFNVRSGQLVSGHQRLRELREIGGEFRDGSVWVGTREFHVRVVDWDEQTEREANVAANNRFIQGDWDESAFEFLAQIRAGMSQEAYRDLNFDQLEDSLRIDLDGAAEAASPDGPYTAKVETPIYEPKRDIPPEVSELFDTSRTEKLLAEIAEAELPDDVRAFLEHAAGRHTIFDYQNIAEYYAHAPRGVQLLIENSALVIVDFNKAIENGFAKLVGALAEAYKNNEA